MIASSFLVSLLLAGAFGHPTSRENRIVGGTLATKGQFPWVVSIQYARSSGGHFCGGSILDKSRVLTAMHCIYGRTAEQVQIQYGVVDNRERANVVNVSKIIVHDKYGVGGMIANDIAILELAADMKLDGVNATPVSLPSSFPSTSPSINAQLCGWGYRTTEEAKLQRYMLWTDLPLWDHTECAKYVGSYYNPKFHVCAGSLDGTHKQCSGDSGGPLTVNGVQYGIVSWSSKPCTITNSPGVFANVANYREYIREKTGI